ncbi:MAG: hypothetical protein WB586_07315 [Chthoniobacterales bacterium]
MKALQFDDVRRLLPHLELSHQGSTQLSPRQIRALEKTGIDPDKFTDRSAQALLDHLQERRQGRLCTIRQAAALEKFSVANPADVLFEDVSDRLTEGRQKMLPLRIEKYLEKCEPAVSGQSGHTTAFLVALALVRGFSLSQEEALPFLRQYNKRCEPPWNEEELKDKLASAANFNPTHKDFPAPGYLLDGDEIPLSTETTSTPQPVHEPEPEYEPDYLQTFVQELALVTVDEEYLESRSEFSCWNRSPAGFLHKIFKPGESVWVTANDKSGDGWIWNHDGPAQNLAELDHLRRGHAGVWYISNPVDGRVHQVERLVSPRNPNGLSLRCTECVTDWRHGVLETDEAPADLWLKALALLELPILAIYLSGKRGPHAVFRVGAHSHEEWNLLVRPYRAHLIKLGACPGTLTPLRLTRLPNCQRGETGQLQKLLYLAPNADSTPICRRPLREDPRAIWQRWEAAKIAVPLDL